MLFSGVLKRANISLVGIVFMLLSAHDSAKVPLEVSFSLKMDGMYQLAILIYEEMFFFEALPVIPVLGSELDDISVVVLLHRSGVGPQRIAYTLRVFMTSWDLVDYYGIFKGDGFPVLPPSSANVVGDRR